LSRFVLDALVTLCWIFEDQATAYTEATLDRLTSGDEAVVPGIWPIEVGNVLAVAERRHMIVPAQSAAFVEQLRQLSITVDLADTDKIFSAVFQAARQYGLSAYDAGYLELAAREGLSLATVDEKLRRAAGGAGVRLA